MAKNPSTVWAQRADVVYVTFQIQDAADVKIDMTETSLDFSAKSKDIDYGVKLDFNTEIVPAECKQRITPYEVAVILQKKDTSAGWWPRLLKEKTKVHWLKVDFNKWRDEDDSEDGREMDTSGFGDMMNGMGGGMGGMPGMGGGMGGMPGMGGGMGGMGGMDMASMMANMQAAGGPDGAASMRMPPGGMADFEDMEGDSDDSDTQEMPDLEEKTGEAAETS